MSLKHPYSTLIFKFSLGNIRQMEFLSYSEHIKLFLSQAEQVGGHLIKEKSVVLPLLLRDGDRKRSKNLSTQVGLEASISVVEERALPLS